MDSGLQPSAAESRGSAVSDIASNALRYWELRRFLYNLVMALVVAAFFLEFRWIPSIMGFIAIFGAAIGANVLYSIVYPIEIFVQPSDFRALWLKFRWVLFALGTILAACLAYYSMVILVINPEIVLP